jgi:hypothetical protein
LKTGITNVFFLVFSAHLIENLPFDERVLRDAKFISHLWRQDRGALSGISRLTQNVAKALGPAQIKQTFKLKKGELFSRIRFLFTLFSYSV